MGAESDFEGVVDLVEMREMRWSQEDQGVTIGFAPIDPSRLAEAREWRENLMDQLSHISDELTELYLGGAAIPAGKIRRPSGRPPCRARSRRCSAARRCATSACSPSSMRWWTISRPRSTCRPRGVTT